MKIAGVLCGYVQNPAEPICLEESMTEMLFLFLLAYTLDGQGIEWFRGISR